MKKLLIIGLTLLVSISAFASNNNMEFHEQVVIGLVKGQAGENCQIKPVYSDHGNSSLITFSHDDGFSTSISTVRTVIKEKSSAYGGSQVRFNFVDIQETQLLDTDNGLEIKVVYKGDHTRTTILIDENENIKNLKSVFLKNGKDYLNCKVD